MSEQAQSLLSLVVAPAIEDTVVDWLMLQQEVAGFTSYPVNGHGSSIHAMSAVEQVAGHRRKILFQICLAEAVVGHLLEGLCRDFNGADLHYWQIPLQAQGSPGG